MSLYSLIILAIGVSVDGFWSGFSYGMRKIRITISSLLTIGFCSFLGSYLSMSLGKSMMTHLSIKGATWAGAVLIICIGIWAIKEGYNQKKQLKKLALEAENEVIDLDEEVTVSKNPFKFLIQVLADPLKADLDKSGTMSIFEAIIIGIAVTMDAAVAAFAAAVAGFNPIWTPITIGITHIILVGSGNFLALKTLLNKIADKLVFLPGAEGLAKSKNSFIKLFTRSSSSTT